MKDKQMLIVFNAVLLAAIVILSGATILSIADSFQNPILIEQSR